MSPLAAITALLVAALLFAAASKKIARSVVTMPIVFTAAGFLLYSSGAQLFPEEAQYEILHLLAEITLVLVLFSDASQVQFSQLRMSAGLPLRMLLVGMPLTIILGTLVASLVSPAEPWAFALLVAAILAPTDAALGQAVVADKSVPENLREAVAIESGLNDGLALPLVIIAALATVEAVGGMGDNAPDNVFLFGLAQVTLGPLAGLAVGFLAARLRDMAVARDSATEAYQGIFFLASAFLCFAVAELIGGNGLIAAFVGGLAFGNFRHSKSTFVAEFMESEGQLLTMATFILFGAVLVPLGFAHMGWKTVLLAIAFLTFVRVVPVFISLTGTGLGWRDKLFLGWFGPRGLASILFALLVLEDFNIAAINELIACVTLTVMLSVLLHGASAFPIVRAYGKRG